MKTKNKSSVNTKTSLDVPVYNEPTFTVDNMIEAWEKGVKDGCGIEITLKTVKGVLLMASGIINDFYENTLKDNGCISVYIRPKIQSAEFIIAINDGVYFDDLKARVLYEKSFEITRNTPNVSFSFIPANSESDIDDVALNNDYYIRIA